MISRKRIGPQKSGFLVLWELLFFLELGVSTTFGGCVSWMFISTSCIWVMSWVVSAEEVSEQNLRGQGRDDLRSDV